MREFTLVFEGCAVLPSICVASTGSARSLHLQVDESLPALRNPEGVDSPEANTVTNDMVSQLRHGHTVFKDFAPLQHVGYTALKP